MFLYRITLVPLEEDLWEVEPGIIAPFYADDEVFDVSAQRSAQILKMLLDRSLDWGYFPNPDKSIFISDSYDQKQAEKH